jgi:DNA-binding MarR family transcriptional regulator
MASTIRRADYQALAEFRYQIRRFLKFSEEALRAAGLEPQQYVLMLAIRGLPEGSEATISTLAGRLLLRHHSTVELVDRLVRRGMIRRVKGKADRRQVLIRLTPRGARVLEKLARQRLAELRSTGEELVRALDNLIQATHKGGASPG